MKIVISAASVVSLCLLAVLLNVMAPSNAGPFGVLAIFVLIYISCLGIIALSICAFSRLIAHLSVIVMARRPIEAVSFRRSYYFATILSAVPVILIGLQSVGRIGFYEYLLVLIYAIIGCTYVHKQIL